MLEGPRPCEGQWERRDRPRYPPAGETKDGQGEQSRRLAQAGKKSTAVHYAVELARRMHAEVTLLHVFPEPSALDYGMGGFPQGEWDQAKEVVEKQLAQETMRAKLAYREVQALLRTGLDLRHEILSAAKEVSADLLVLSTHGYTGWKHFLFGSDAERILHSASCPILVVR